MDSQHLEQERLLQQYDREVAAAFKRLLKAFLEHIEKGIGNSHAIAGRCGAECGAAHKRCKRGLVLLALQVEREAGTDITPAVAAHVFERLIGRGVDERAAAEQFATPGRTAADKSTVGAADLAELETHLALQIQGLIDQMTVIRELHREAYRKEARVQGRKARIKSARPD